MTVLLLVGAWCLGYLSGITVAVVIMRDLHRRRRPGFVRIDRAVTSNVRRGDGPVSE